jgi:hypothetical protein
MAQKSISRSRKEIEGSRSATGEEDESRDTKTFLKKGYRERERPGSKRIISMHTLLQKSK